MSPPAAPAGRVRRGLHARPPAAPPPDILPYVEHGWTVDHYILCPNALKPSSVAYPPNRVTPNTRARMMTKVSAVNTARLNQLNQMTGCDG